MEQLVELMRKVLAESFVFYVKAQNYHWNVEGINFPQFHDFFGKIYEDVQCSIDTTAEEIRALGEYSPGTLRRFIELSGISEEIAVPPLNVMLATLINDNNILLASLNAAFDSATRFNQQGLADFLAGRIDAHRKHGWMLNSCLKGV